VGRVPRSQKRRDEAAGEQGLHQPVHEHRDDDPAEQHRAECRDATVDGEQLAAQRIGLAARQLHGSRTSGEAGVQRQAGRQRRKGRGAQR
jgi:hypothetical protein